MKHLSLVAFIFVLLLQAFFANKANAKDVYFDSKWTLWQNADILIWTPDKEAALDPKEFCLSLRRYNSGIGEPKCRLFGEWERDTVAMRYATWLSNNIEAGLEPHHLKARHPAMMAKFQTLEDKIVLYVADKGNHLLIAVFDENSSEPQAAGTVIKTPDKIAQGDEVANAFFGHHTKRRLTKEERLKMESEPDDLYKETPTFRSWAGISAGYAQAQIPLTPSSWYRRHIRSRVGDYRVTKDSVSLWNFMDDSTPLFTLYAGGIWFGFIGGEISKEASDDDGLFIDYFENAQFPGGDEACMKWLQEHIKYPEGYTSNQPQGKVVVSFIVEKDGSLDGIKVMKSPDPLLSEEAIRVVREMPKWKPAHQYFPPPRQGSEAVRSRFLLPVIFRKP